jgi:ribonuclease HI
MTKKQESLPVRMSAVLRRIAAGHTIETVSQAEGCSKDALKEALVSLADRIEVEFGLHTVKVMVDGASRGNPGPAGIGAAILDNHDRSLAELSTFIGTATNNEAEYQALVAGLGLALERGYPNVAIYTDSELMAKQIRGEYRIREPRLKERFAMAHRLLAKFKKWEIKAIPRSENRLADRLSNLAIDKGSPEAL